MLRLLLCTLALLFHGLSFANIDQSEAILIINAKNESELLAANKLVLPRNFRSTTLGFKKKAEGKLPSTEGLSTLRISGSSQFTEKGFEAILKELGCPKNLFIVDLRQESHGFLNGTPVSIYARQNKGNLGKSLSKIEQEEKAFLKDAVMRRNIVLSKVEQKDKLGKELPETSPMPFVATGDETEEMLISRYKAGYIRIPVTDAMRPTDEMVDRFIEFFKGLPNESWIHFHCSAGVGRTTSFMVMYDMMKNSKIVNFDDILKRQYMLGGHDLSNYGSKTSWKYPAAIERYQFMKDFYDYAKSNNDNFATTWTEYLKKKAK